MKFYKGQIAWNKGVSITEETRRKISKVLKGKPRTKPIWNKGLKTGPLTEDHRRKISEVRKGHLVSEETRKKISENHAEISEETRKKMNETKRGFKHSEETKRKMSESSKGKHLSIETRLKISEAHKGKSLPDRLGDKNPSKRPEVREKMSKSHKGIHFGEKNSFFGKHHSEETKRKLSDSQRGENSSNWHGGISFEPYSKEWTKTLKKAIRERDGYTCRICGYYPSFDCHHIDYDKKNCDPKNLITLCNKCHTKTNSNREYWIIFLGE